MSAYTKLPYYSDARLCRPFKGYKYNMTVCGSLNVFYIFLRGVPVNDFWNQTSCEHSLRNAE